jgi:hypothetical protein
MWRSVAIGIVLAGVVAGCSLGGGSGVGAGAQTTAGSDHRLDLSHVQPGVDANAWAASSVRRMHPRGGAHFTDIRCDVRKRPPVVCTGELYYAPGLAVRVPQYFRITVTGNGSSRVVPYCPPVVGNAGTAPRIFCPLHSYTQ